MCHIVCMFGVFMVLIFIYFFHGNYVQSEPNYDNTVDK